MQNENKLFLRKAIQKHILRFKNNIIYENKNKMIILRNVVDALKVMNHHQLLNYLYLLV